MSYQYNVTNMRVNGYSLDQYYSTTRKESKELLDCLAVLDLQEVEGGYVKPSQIITYLGKSEKNTTKQNEMMFGLAKTFDIARKGLNQFDSEDIKELANKIQECKKNEQGRWFALGTPFNMISKVSSIAAKCFLVLGCVWGAVTVASLIFPISTPLVVSGLISLAICLPARACFRLLSAVTGKIGDMLLNWNVNSTIRNQDETLLFLEGVNNNQDIAILKAVDHFDHDAVVVKWVLEDIQGWLSDAKVGAKTEKEIEELKLFKEYVSKLQRDLDDQFSRREFIKQAYTIKA